MMRRLSTLLIALPLALTACGGAPSATPVPAATGAGAGAVVVKDCAGQDVSFAAAPERVVTLDGYAAQTMVRLGLTAKIVGTGFPAPFTVDTSPYKEELATIPVLAERIPVTEVVAGQRPDLVVTSFSTFGGPVGSPKEADLATMNAKGLAGCMPGGGMAMGETPSTSALTDLTPTYDFIRKLGAVFGVRDRAEKLVTDLRARQSAVTSDGARPRVMIVQDDPVAGQPIKTSGSATITHAILTLAGGENLFGDVGSMHADASPEEVVKRDPQVIWVITDYSFAKIKGQELVEKVRQNPLLAETTAVKEGKVFSASQYLVAFPSPLNLDGLEKLAADLHAGS
ncbi:ABC transporter substrate-binding protein [Acrocarpospora corrugata]|uniref:ABC transporter substrate-binding protein n=1 Tax=Acrocarpospora corrugata TaxID=35763 RepID=A0A5M3W8E0_9ACTN|nr:ABC transporter substrate-binding protein [Acrocarpospora corrugata]GES04510.1 ABC transporter substrate-binding protein [Acrocarpospora corrugata]